MGLSGEYSILKKPIDGARIRRRRRNEVVLVEIFADGSVVVHGRKRLHVAIVHRMDVQTGAAELLTEEIALKNMPKRHRKIYGMIRATGNSKECMSVDKYVKADFELGLLRDLSGGE